MASKEDNQHPLGDSHDRDQDQHPGDVDLGHGDHHGHFHGDHRHKHGYGDHHHRHGHGDHSHGHGHGHHHHRHGHGDHHHGHGHGHHHHGHGHGDHHHGRGHGEHHHGHGHGDHHQGHGGHGHGGHGHGDGHHDDGMDEILKPGTTLERVAELYDGWASDYGDPWEMSEEEGKDWIMEGEQIIAYIGTNKDAKILDLAAGNGYLGYQLKKLGYANIDALDGSGGMLEGAKKADLYKNYFQILVGPQKIPAEDDEYDAVVSMDGFIPGHVPPDSFADVIRVVKPGGFIMVMMFEHHLYQQESYSERLGEVFDKHVAQMDVKQVDKKKLVTSFGDDEVWFVFQVLEGKLNQQS